MYLFIICYYEASIKSDIGTCESNSLSSSAKQKNEGKKTKRD